MSETQINRAFLNRQFLIVIIFFLRQLMCFWFEKALQKNNHILSIVRDVNEMFADMYLK